MRALYLLSSSARVLAAAILTVAETGLLSATDRGDLKIDFSSFKAERRGPIIPRYLKNNPKEIPNSTGTACVDLISSRGANGFLPKSISVPYEVDPGGELVTEVPACRPVFGPADFAMRLTIGSFSVESKSQLLLPTPATVGEDPKAPCARPVVNGFTVQREENRVTASFDPSSPGRVLVELREGDLVEDRRWASSTAVFKTKVTESTSVGIVADPSRVPLFEDSPSQAGINPWLRASPSPEIAQSEKGPERVRAPEPVTGTEVGFLRVTVAKPDDERTGKLQLNYTLRNPSAVLSAGLAQIEVTPRDIVKKRFVRASRDVDYKVQGEQLTAELPFCHPIKEPAFATITLRVGSDLAATSEPVFIGALPKIPGESEADANCEELDISRLATEPRPPASGSNSNVNPPAGARGSEVTHLEVLDTKRGDDRKATVSSDPRSPVYPSLPVKGEPRTWPEWIRANFLWLLIIFAVAVLLNLSAYPYAKALMAKGWRDEPKAPEAKAKLGPTATRPSARSPILGIHDPATLAKAVPPQWKTDRTTSLHGDGAGTPTQQTPESLPSPRATAERGPANSLTGELQDLRRDFGISIPLGVATPSVAAVPRPPKPEEYEEAFCAALTRWWENPSDRAELRRLFERIGIADAKWVDVGNSEEALRSVKWTGPYEWSEKESGGWIFWRAPGGKNMALPADPACLVSENALRFAERIVYGLERPWDSLRFQYALRPCNLRSATDVSNGRVVYHVEVKGAIQCAGRNLDMVSHYRSYEAFLPEPSLPPRAASTRPGAVESVAKSLDSRFAALIKESLGAQRVGPGKAEVLKEVTGLKGILDSIRETPPQQPAATSVSAPLPTPAPTSSAAPKTESTQTDAAPPQTAAASPTAEAEVHKRASSADSLWPEEKLKAAYNKAAGGNGDRKRRLESLQKALASHFKGRIFEIHHLETTDGTNYTKKDPGSTPQQHFVTAEIGSDLWVFAPAGPLTVWEYSVAYTRLLGDPKINQIRYILRPARLVRRNGANAYAFADALVASREIDRLKPPATEPIPPSGGISASLNTQTSSIDLNAKSEHRVAALLDRKLSALEHNLRQAFISQVAEAKKELRAEFSSAVRSAPNMPRETAPSPTPSAGVDQFAHAQRFWQPASLRQAYAEAPSSGTWEERLHMLETVLEERFKDRAFVIEHLETTDGRTFVKRDPTQFSDQHFLTAETGDDLWVFVPPGALIVYNYAQGYKSLLGDPNLGHCMIRHVVFPARLTRKPGSNVEYALVHASATECEPMP
jgi:hypothetical protein